MIYVVADIAADSETLAVTVVQGKLKNNIQSCIVCILPHLYKRAAGNHLAIQHNTVAEEILSEGTAPPEDTNCGTQLGKRCAYGIGSLHSYELINKSLSPLQAVERYSH